MLDQCVFIDVSELPPPEPLAKSMQAVKELKPGQYLHIHHWREPLLLYERLEKLNFTHTAKLGDGEFCEIFVWRKDDAIAVAAAERVANQLPLWDSSL